MHVSHRTHPLSWRGLLGCLAIAITACACPQSKPAEEGTTATAPSEPAPTEPAPTPTPTEPAPTPTEPTPTTPTPSTPTPDPTPNPTTPTPGDPGQTQSQTAPAQGSPCGAGDACAKGLTCVGYYGIAGPRGPRMNSCEIPCKDNPKGCPAGQTCTTIADGPGQVCRPTGR
jgi:hypothetical protein